MKLTLEFATRDLDLSDDTFSRKERVHDWRNHVPDLLELSWGTLTNRERMLVAAIAEEAARNEDWD